MTTGKGAPGDAAAGRRLDPRRGESSAGRHLQFAAVWVQRISCAPWPTTLRRHFRDRSRRPGRFLQLLEAVIERQAALVARWQLVGFVHGVMNTDNMTISGETIDYGPCAFMDGYDPATVFSSIDTEGR